MTNYFNLGGYGYAIILGIILSGVLTYINVYNITSSIDKEYIACENNPELAKKLRLRFILTLTFSSLAIVLGIIVAILSKYSGKDTRIFSFSAIIMGIVGIFFSVSNRYRNTSNIIKLSASGLAFIIFILIGIGYSLRGGKSGDIEMKDIDL